jgi:uncharacterized membrane protein
MAWCAFLAGILVGVFSVLALVAWALRMATSDQGDDL